RHQNLLAVNAQFSWDGYSANQACVEANPHLADEHCALSHSVEPTIALLGDSHSNALYPGLAQVAGPIGEVIVNFARGGCVPFFDVSSHSRGSTDYCAEFTNRALEFTMSLPSVHTIILASRGPLYTTGTGF